MDLSPRRLAACHGVFALILCGAAALALWLATRGARTLASQLDIGRFGLALAFGGGTWLSAGPFRLAIPLRPLLGLGLASIAATSFQWYGEGPPGQGWPWEIMRGCSLVGAVLSPLPPLAVPVFWGAAMACLEFGPDSRRLAATRIAGIAALSSMVAGLTAAGTGVLAAIAAYGIASPVFHFGQRIPIQVIGSLSIACILWAAWQSITLASGGSALTSRALRIHRLILLSATADLVLIVLWVIPVDSSILLYRAAAVGSEVLVPVLLRLSLALHLWALWSTPKESVPGPGEN